MWQYWMDEQDLWSIEFYQLCALPYLYNGEMEVSSLSLACNLGLHPSTLAHLTPISSSLPKMVVIGLMHSLLDTFSTLTLMISYLYVLNRYGT